MPLVAFRSRLIRRACALSLLCALSAGAAAQAPRSPAPVGASGRLVYEFLLAEIAGARGEIGLASKLYLDLARSTADARIARRAAELALHARDPEAAVDAARIWARAEPDSAEARRILAGLLVGNSLEASQLQLARILALSDEALPQTLLGLNRAFARIQDKAAVSRTVRWLTEPYLTYPEAHLVRAQAALLAGAAAQAADDAQAALDLQPGWEPAVVLKADALRAVQPAASVALLEDYLSHAPDSRDARLALARSLLAVKQYAAARVQFERLAQAYPDDFELRYAAGVVALELRDFDAAVAHFERVMSVMPHQADTVRLHLGMAEAGRGRQEQARAWFRQVEQDPALVMQAQLRIAESYAGEGRFDEAGAVLARLQIDDPAVRVKVRLLEAQLLRDSERTSEALALLDRELQLQPDQPELLYESAMLAERLDDLAGMESKLRRLIALQPEHGHAYNALGYALADRGLRLPEAEALIDRALELLPDDPFILDSKGWVRFRQGDADSALTYLRRALAARPDAEIAAHLGEVLWSIGRRKEAREVWAEALRAHPDNRVLQTTRERLDKR